MALAQDRVADPAAVGQAVDPAALPAPEQFAPGAKPRFPEKRERAFTFYAAQMSSEAGWEDVFFNPVLAEYTSHYLLVGAVSQAYAQFKGGRLQVEREGQIAFNFGDQEYWEFNLVPVVLRWQHWPWTHRFASSAAFGIGLSYTSQLPEIEVELENDSRQLLVYWVAEVTAGPHDGRWAASLRLHHRSVAYGLFGEDGGMNAVGLGMRYRF